MNDNGSHGELIKQANSNHNADTDDPSHYKVICNLVIDSEVMQSGMLKVPKV